MGTNACCSSCVSPGLLQARTALALPRHLAAAEENS
jgi:hypothetical protein